MVEAMVEREYERLKGSVEGFCGCGLCRDDVLVYALNRLHPRYVAHRKGEIITSVELGAEQSVADVSVALMDGFRRVKANPRADHARTSQR